MTFAGFPYTIPLSPTPPVPKMTPHSPSIVTEEEKNDENVKPKSKEDHEKEAFEKEKIKESLKPLEDEHFFFFEVLVDSIEMTTKEEEPEAGVDDSSLKVRIKFEALPNMIISQEDFMPSQGHEELISGKVVYEGGKNSIVRSDEDKAAQWSTKCGISSLFPMTPIMLIKSFQRNTMEVALYKSTDEEGNIIIIGQTEFCLDEEFCRCILQAADIQFAASLPKSMIKQEVYSLTDKNSTEIAKISIMVRLACFGNVIMTRCERKESSYTYIFKNTPIIESFKCQQYRYKNHSIASKTSFSKDCKDKCNCLKKNNSELICPPPEPIDCTCLCECPDKGKSDVAKKLKNCPFQSNCPFLKPKNQKLNNEKQ